jgi:Mrp family chromosome partitioning ATPase
VLPLADTSVWMRMADGVLLVTRQGITEKRPLQRGLEAIELKKLIGVLLNCSKSSVHDDYYYRMPSVPAPNDSSTK